MNNVQTVFDFIKNKCISNDNKHNDCYRELNNMLTANLGERPTLAYVRELSYAGLIKFNEFSRSISLTRKGRITQSVSGISLAA
jgi:predicted transcriptional regulator